jgi:hypothetical protein
LPFFDHIEWTTSWAQPTPDSTAIAFVAQFMRQAPQSMQPPRFTIAAFRRTTANTA